jgi:hypothetical protein
MIDEEIKRIVGSAYENARTFLEKNRDSLDKLAKRLLQKEVLDRREIEEIVGVSKKPVKKKPVVSEQQAASIELKEKKPQKEKSPLDKLKLATNEAGGD